MSRRITNTPEAYNQLPDSGAPGTYRALASGADEVDVTGSADNTRFNLKGNPTIAVSTWFSGAADDTCEVTVALYHYDGSTYTALGVQTATATAGDYTDGTNNFAPILFFDTAGANAAEVRLAAPSAGNVAARVWTFGAEPEGAA